MLLWLLGRIYPFKLVFFFSLDIPRSEMTGSQGSSSFSFLRNLYIVFQWLHQYMFTPTIYKGSFFSTSLPTFVFLWHLDDSLWQVWGEISLFDVHLFDNLKSAEHLFTFLLVIYMSSLEKCLFGSSAWTDF